MRVRRSEAIDLGNQRIKPDRAQSVAQPAPTGLDAAAASDVQQKERAVAPELQFQNALDQRAASSVLLHCP
jgi:hypothetical protein